MNTQFITLNKGNIDKEHICCAISDKKCIEGYNMKKEWLKSQFEKGYVFRRLDERAKVFIEYVPAENAWMPIDAPNYLAIGCFWVSGQYKGKGYAKALLQIAIDDAKSEGKSGLVTVVGTKKFHFMSDAKWLIRQGFEIVDSTASGFNLVALKFNKDVANPKFKECAKNSVCDSEKGITVYYSNRCPFTEFHVHTSLRETAEKRNLPLNIIKLETLEQAQQCPTPATIFSLFYNGKFITTDVSVCMDSRFDKVIGR